ncbi:LacI family DNA-binding transcriptional regulator [Roseovarius amoyensis]|uniref:LacI family DNA-binding transcriptional regulator n=1 Tax=Roseovarius amoyensis TaxID=2211448 RepID=UPI000DBE2EAF|nr:LacI family DNA-binding transcriptional regulator [Roseovarius amoyensis]
MPKPKQPTVGSKRPTIKDVATVAGVSVGSASRVLNGHVSVNDDIRTRVEAAVAQLGYQPNAAAQSMRNRSSRTVGCIIRDINIPGLAAFVRDAHDVLMQAGYVLMLTKSEGDPQRESQLISVMEARQVDALLISHGSETDQALLDRLQKVNFPVVLFDRINPSWADRVLVDHRSSTIRAVQMLFNLGHRRIALLTGTQDLFSGWSRVEGYREAHILAGIPLDPDLLRVGSFEADFGYEESHLLLDRPDRPTAIIAGGIEMLPGVLRSIRAKGMSIPRDVSVIGTLNSPVAELYDPPITVENWDYSTVGRIVARMILDRIRGDADAPPKEFVLQSDIISRDSCAAPPSLA